MGKPILELICKKTFYEGDKIFFKEGDIYNCKKATDDYGDYYVVYEHRKEEVDPDFQIFNPTHGIIIDGEEYPCIKDYFYTKAEWREKQIDSIFE